MHHRPSVVSLVRALATALVAVMLGCANAPSGELRVIVDSSLMRDTLEVIALPFDPAALMPSLAEGDARGDSTQLLRTLRDSAGALTRAFAEERSRINTEVLDLRTQDRTTAAYVQAEVRMRERIAGAEALRDRRDRVRDEAHQLASALGVDSEVAGGSRVPWIHVEHAARATGRAPLTAPARDTIRLRADSGRWWITRGIPDQFVIARAHAVELGTGEQVTVRLSP